MHASNAVTRLSATGPMAARQLGALIKSIQLWICVAQEQTRLAQLSFGLSA